VGVDPGDDTKVVAICDGGHAALPLTWLGWHARPGRWTRQGAGPLAQAPLRSRSVVPRTGPRSLSRQVRSRTPELGLADLRVRPNEPEPCPLPTRPPKRPPRSSLPISRTSPIREPAQNASTEQRCRCPERTGDVSCGPVDSKRAFGTLALWLAGRRWPPPTTPNGVT
jgi:hypothetical protein